MGKQDSRPATDDQRTQVRQVFEGVVKNLAFEQAEAILGNLTVFEGGLEQMIVGLAQEERVKALGGSEIERWAAFYEHVLGLDLGAIESGRDETKTGLLVLTNQLRSVEKIFCSLPRALEGLKAHKWTHRPLEVAVSRNVRHLGETWALTAKCIQTELLSFEGSSRRPTVAEGMILVAFKLFVEGAPEGGFEVPCLGSRTTVLGMVPVLRFAKTVMGFGLYVEQRSKPEPGKLYDLWEITEH